VALSSVIWSLQIAGQPGTQAAEAARISKAIARTVHSVTGWQVVLRREGNDASQTIVCTMADKHLYIRGTRAYLLQNGAWAELPASSAGLIQNNCNFNIQWAFAVLPSHLAKGQFSVISSSSSRQTEGFRYRVAGTGGLSAEVTAWVDRHTGLVQHLDQVVMRSGRVVERDTAQYSYTR
jgi:hypothetical protein